MIRHIFFNKSTLEGRKTTKHSKKNAIKLINLDGSSHIIQNKPGRG